MRRHFFRLVRFGGAAFALAALLLAWGIAFPRTIPAVHAGGNCANGCVHWSSGMIYAGQNNGNPEGPVGEHAAVHGEGFTAVAGQQVTFAVAPGDTLNPPSGSSSAQLCQMAPASPIVPLGSGQVDSSGQFDYSFDWPDAASAGLWSFCVYGTGGVPTGNIDDGPFSVLSAVSPSVAISAGSVAAGGTVTITGQNWLPAQDKIFVYVGPCADCDGAPIASGNATSASNGAFSITLPIAANTAPGQYVVSAHNESGVLDLMDKGPKLTVALAPTATPQPTATASPTLAPTAVAGGTSGTAGSSGGNGLLIALLVVAALLLAIIAGLIGFVIARGRNTTPGGPSGGSGPSGGPGGSGPPGSGYPANTPAGQYSRPITPGGYPGGSYQQPGANPYPGQYPPATGQTLFPPADPDAPTEYTPTPPYYP
ncbi:MAG: hypothetical protein OJF49_001361 [Ktedonobacterales bacterium]|jgi:hypothetical protein|nr:MAG: hypothetical protein OJF49_001361 [Ktedonobacterales bacterium]